MMLSYRHGLSLVVISTFCILIMIYLKDLKVMSNSQKESLKKSTSSSPSTSTILFTSNDSQLLVHPKLQPQSSEIASPTPIPAPTEQGTQISPDGCGIEDGVEPKWLRQTPDDLILLADVKRCKQRLVETVNSGDNEDMAWRDDVNLTY